MKHRKIIVEFKTPAGDKRLDGIEVKFSVDKLMSAVMNKASIEICNLAQEDIEYLTTYTSQFIAINERKRIRIFAGYEEDGVSLIFDGDVVEGMPTNPPDRWIRMKALSGYYSNKEPVSKTLNGCVSNTIEEHEKQFIKQKVPNNAHTVRQIRKLNFRLSEKFNIHPQKSHI